MGIAAFANPIVDRRLSLFRHLGGLWLRAFSRDDETNTWEYSLSYSSGYRFVTIQHRGIPIRYICEFLASNKAAEKRESGICDRSGDERI
jgi:hypothetical protein